MSKESAVVATFLGVVIMIAGITAVFLVRHPAVATILAHMPPA